MAFMNAISQMLYGIGAAPFFDSDEDDSDDVAPCSCGELSVALLCLDGMVEEEKRYWGCHQHPRSIRAAVDRAVARFAFSKLPRADNI